MNAPNAKTSVAALGPAPADARSHPRWPLWKMLLAYAALTCLAAAAIWYIDLKAHRPPALRPAEVKAAATSMAATPTSPVDAGGVR